MNKNTLFFYLWNYGVTWIPSRLGELIRQKVLKMFCRECGVNVNVAPHTLIKGANSMIIGDNVWIGERCLIIANNTVSIGDNTIIAMGTSINTGGHKGSKTYNHLIAIGKSVLIGMNCTILGNLEIGDNAIVGAGTVVSKNVFANTTVIGNKQEETNNDNSMYKH